MGILTEDYFCSFAMLGTQAKRSGSSTTELQSLAQCGCYVSGKTQYIVFKNLFCKECNFWGIYALFLPNKCSKASPQSLNIDGKEPSTSCSLSCLRRPVLLETCTARPEVIGAASRTFAVRNNYHASRETHATAQGRKS